MIRWGGSDGAGILDVWDTADGVLLVLELGTNVVIY